MDNVSMNGKEKFEIAREIIRHEDGLVNNRVTWLLVLQGFLFTTFVNGIGLYEKVRNHPHAHFYITIGLVIIGVLGIAANLIAGNVVRLSFRQTDAVKKWWEEQKEEQNILNQFPPIVGKFPKEPDCYYKFYWLFSTGRMPYILMAVWFILIALLLVGILT